MTALAPAAFADLLQKALTDPGIVSTAYRAFHGYSLGNQLLALVQCADRGLEPGPIATFMSWKDKGRYVRKGQKALTLCMPVTCKRTDASDPDAEPDVFTRFVYKPHWFVLAQTDGEPIAPATTPAWDATQALTALAITEEPFTHPDGNCQGYARQRTIAVSPVAAMPHKTRLHELAHVVLGHTSEGAELNDDERTPRSLREVEAEAVALVCLDALNLPGAEYARGYIQHWHQSGEPIPERSAQRIFKAADQILRAGEVDPTGDAQPVSPYFEVAAADARQYARSLEPQTHWIDYDAPVTRSLAQASCGSIVDVDQFSQTPTCTACRKQQAIADTFRF